tara:strand:- start:96 stop:272 length:177 start_codon:yes stop_codon:yes gene_type:complete
MAKEPEGFGDSLASFIEITGAKKVFKKVQEIRGKEEEDCGCDKRREKLNKIFPYKNKK